MPTILSRLRRVERELNLTISPVPTPAVVRRLRRLRVRRGLSLRTVADEVPCSHVFLHDIERGRRGMSYELELRLTAALQRLEEAPRFETRPRAELDKGDGDSQ